MAPLPPRDQRHPWLRYQVQGYTKDIVHDFEHRLETIFGRLRMVYTEDDGQDLFTSHALRRLFEIRRLLLGGARCRMTWRQFILALGLHTDEEMAEDGFEAYWLGSVRVIPGKGDLRDYWIKISSDRDFLGPAPSYVYIRDPVRRLCHRMISCSSCQTPKKVTGIDLFYLRSIDQGTANVPYLIAQYLFRHAEGRKSGARLSGGYFIGCLAAYFGLVSDEGLRGLLVITHELSMIDLHELVRLNIYVRLGDTWAWVAPRPERQPTTTAGGQRMPRVLTMRLNVLDAEVHILRSDIGEQRGVLDSMAHDFSRFTTWTVTSFSRMMVRSRVIYTSYSDSLVPYQRRTRRRIGDANTSIAQQDEQQPDP
ncbi:hypothetical protein Tco_1395077 [Tanacetum coccineum]